MKNGIFLAFLLTVTSATTFASGLVSCSVIISASGCASNSSFGNGLLPDGNWAAAIFSSGALQTSNINTSTSTSTSTNNSILLGNSSGLFGLGGTTSNTFGNSSIFTSTTFSPGTNFNTGVTSLFGLGGTGSNPFSSGVILLNFGQQIAPSTTIFAKSTTAQNVVSNGPVSAAPEPSTVALIGLSLAGLAGLSRKRKA